MTFNANIPQATDLISASQSQIQTNFSQSNTVFGVDHTAFDVVTNQGKHKKSTYVEQLANPATSPDELTLFSKDLGGATTLYLRKENNGTVIQMSGQDPVAASEGQTFLPGGMILKWGKQVTVSDGVLFTYGTGAFPTATFMVCISPAPADVNQNTVNDYAYVRQNPAINGFTCTTVKRASVSILASCVINYIAIGN